MLLLQTIALFSVEIIKGKSCRFKRGLYKLDNLARGMAA